MADIEVPELEDIEEARKDRFTRRVALAVAGYAVLLAITSLGGSNAMKETMLSQMQASDQWAFYQAKAIRGHIYKIERRRAEAEAAARGGSRELEELAREFQREEDRYDQEKGDIKKEAEGHQSHRDLALRRDPYFDYSEVLLQIAIVMSSVAMLSGSRQVFYASVALAVVGGLLCANGFALVVKIPGLE